MTLDCGDLAWRKLKAHRPCGFLLSCQGRGGRKGLYYSSETFRQSVFNHKERGERSKANRDRVKISPALTDLSSLLHDGEAFIYYFKEVEKIITTVIPHLMCPKPPITPWPAALCWIYRERAHPRSKTDGHESLLLCKIYEKKTTRTSHLSPKIFQTPPSSSSIITYLPVYMIIRLTRAGPSSSSSSYAVCPLSLVSAQFQRHWDMREGSFLGSLVLLISSLITGHYSWVSDASLLPRTLDMMHSDTLSPTNK